MKKLRNRIGAVLVALALIGASAVPAQAVVIDAAGPVHAPGELVTKMPTGKPPAVKNIAKKSKLNERKRDKLTKGNPTAKSGPTTYLTPGTPPVYRYSGSQMLNMADAATGFGATITVSSPYMYPPDGNTTCSGGKNHHTLAEIAVRDPNNNVAEVGWHKAPCEYGDNNPHLFAFWWVAGTPMGYNQAAGFLDAVGCSPCVGDSLAAHVNTNKQFGINYVADGPGGVVDGMWLSYGGNYVGVWPATGWTGAGQTFDDFDDVLPYVESTSEFVDTCTDMGSGSQGGSGSSTAMQGLVLQGTTDTEDFDNPSNMYTDSVNAWPIAGISDTYVRPGGRGYNSVGGDSGGATGSCAPSSAGSPTAASLQLWAEFCPDNQTTTGCNGALGTFNTSTAPLNTCVALSSTPVYTNGPSQYDLTIAQNNAGVGGRTYVLYAQTNCGGATLLSLGNGVSGNPSFQPHAVKRTS